MMKPGLREKDITVQQLKLFLWILLLYAGGYGM